jgi:hypothetical protein
MKEDEGWWSDACDCDVQAGGVGKGDDFAL